MIRNIFSTFTSRFLSAAFGFILIIVLSNNLGATGKGEASLILTTIIVIILFCDFVGGSALVYLGPRHSNFQLAFSSYLWSILICSLSYFPLSYFNILPEKFIVHTIAIALLQSFTNIHLAMMISREKIFQHNLIKLLQAFLNLAWLLTFFYFIDYVSIFAYLGTLYISSLLSLLITFYYFPIHKLAFDLSEIKSLVKKTFRLGAFNQFANLAQFLNYRISFYILTIFWGTYEVGIYSNGVSIAESIWIFANSISLVQYSRISNSTDMVYNRQLTLSLCKFTVLLMAIPVAILYFLPSELYIFIFGQEFGEMTIAIKALAPGILLYNITKIITHFFSGTGRYHFNMIGSLSGLAATLAIGFYLIPQNPLFGAGITASISYLVSSAILLLIFVQKEKIPLRKFLPERNDWEMAKRELREGSLK